MPRFIRSVLSQDVSRTAADIVTFDLPVNPLSHVLITVKVANDTGTISDYDVLIALLATIQNVEVLFKGQAIVSGSLTDIAMLSWLLTGARPWGVNFVETNNDVRSITVLIPLTRRPFWPMEAFPASRRGELQLRLTYAAAQGGVDTIVEQIETVELLDVTVERFVKYTSLTVTPGSTGNHDVDLPIGNPILGVLLFSTTVPNGASYDATVGQVRVLVDNVEFGYAQTNWETLHGEVMNRHGGFLTVPQFHGVNAAGAGQEDTQQQQMDAAVPGNYAYLDYDPLMDGTYALDTAGHSRVNLRIDQEPSADEMRALPIELISVGS